MLPGCSCWGGPDSSSSSKVSPPRTETSVKMTSWQRWNTAQILHNNQRLSFRLSQTCLTSRPRLAFLIFRHKKFNKAAARQRNSVLGRNLNRLNVWVCWLAGWLSPSSWPEWSCGSAGRTVRARRVTGRGTGWRPSSPPASPTS